MNDIVLEYINRIDKELIGIYDTGPKLLVEPINHVFLESSCES